jgi:hypothetical protein
VGSRTTVPFLVLYVRMGSRTIAWDLIPRWISYNTVSRTAWDRIAWDLVLATAWDLVLATAWDLVLCGISYSVGSRTIVQRGILYSAGSKHESLQICDHEELQHEFVIDV